MGLNGSTQTFRLSTKEIHMERNKHINYRAQPKDSLIWPFRSKKRNGVRIKILEEPTCFHQFYKSQNMILILMMTTIKDAHVLDSNNN